VLTVTSAQPSDVAELADLIVEMDRFYGSGPDQPADQRQAEITAMLFGQSPAAHVLLARRGGALAGFASYSFLWPAVGLSRSLFLKELYVAQAHRRRGIGRLLMRRIFELATEAGCSRVEWMTEHVNTDAQRFYQQLGYPPNTEKVFYRAQHDAAPQASQET